MHRKEREEYIKEGTPDTGKLNNSGRFLYTVSNVTSSCLLLVDAQYGRASCYPYSPSFPGCG